MDSLVREIPLTRKIPPGDTPEGCLDTPTNKLEYKDHLGFCSLKAKGEAHDSSNNNNNE